MCAWSCVFTSLCLSFFTCNMLCWTPLCCSTETHLRVWFPTARACKILPYTFSCHQSPCLGWTEMTSPAFGSSPQAGTEGSRYIDAPTTSPLVGQLWGMLYTVSWTSQPGWALPAPSDNWLNKKHAMLAAFPLNSLPQFTTSASWAHRLNALLTLNSLSQHRLISVEGLQSM